jgi:MFS family permease
MGLYDDAKITTKQFSNLALFFYVSYLVLEFPHGYGMQKFPTAKYLGAAVTLWGLVTAITCVCKNYGALVATRILLGCFESAVAPSLILITSMWYKKKEQPLRTGIWYLGVGTGTMIGSLISFGFQHYYSPTFTSWQIMFLVVGLITIAVGITGTYSSPSRKPFVLTGCSHFPAPGQPHVIPSQPCSESMGHRASSREHDRYRKQAVQMASSGRVLDGSSDLDAFAHNHFFQRAKRRCFFVPSNTHQVIWLRLEDYRIIATPLGRRERHLYRRGYLSGRSL